MLDPSNPLVWKVPILKKYPNSVFIETGTYIGTGIKCALEAGFSKVIGIEACNSFYSKCSEIFRNDSRVQIVLGDSAKILSQVISHINEPITFFLDAHEFEGQFVDRLCPVILELNQIAQHPIRNHTILIDDKRMFPNWGIPLVQVLSEVFAINPDYTISYENNTMGDGEDIIVCQI